MTFRIFAHQFQLIIDLIFRCFTAAAVDILIRSSTATSFAHVVVVLTLLFSFVVVLILSSAIAHVVVVVVFSSAVAQVVVALIFSFAVA